jgi:hypothetical protein
VTITYLLIQVFNTISCSRIEKYHGLNFVIEDEFSTEISVI